MRSRFAHFRTHHQTRRLAGFDYTSAGWYFVTVCTRGREPLFGHIRRGIVGLTEAGCIAHACWHDIPAHDPHVRLGAFIVMPNHVHGLIGLAPTTRPAAGNAPGQNAAGLRAAGQAPPLHHPPVPTGPAPSHPPGAMGPAPPHPPASPALPLSGSLSSVVGSYKSAVTRTVRQTDPSFAWQPRFHDHIVRNERALRHIWTYIEENPARWTQDTFHPAA